MAVFKSTQTLTGTGPHALNTQAYFEFKIGGSGAGGSSSVIQLPSISTNQINEGESFEITDPSGNLSSTGPQLQKS